jgi:hypothetical protein
MSKQKKERDNVNGAQMSLVSAEKAVLICPCSFSSALLCFLQSLFGSAVEPAFDQILIYFFLLKLSAVCTF